MVTKKWVQKFKDILLIVAISLVAFNIYIIYYFEDRIEDLEQRSALIENGIEALLYAEN